MNLSFLIFLMFALIGGLVLLCLCTALMGNWFPTIFLVALCVFAYLGDNDRTPFSGI